VDPEAIERAGKDSRSGRVRPRRGRGRAQWALASVLLALATSGAAPPSTAAGAAPDSAGSYEAPPVLKASDFLDADLLRGDNYAVDEKVTNDGLFNTYTIQSEFGTFQPRSNSLVRIRIHEMGAIAQLKEVDKVAVAAGAAVDSVADMGKGAYHLVTNPVETATGIGGAASRLFARIGRSAKRSEEKLGMDGPNKADAGQSTGDKVASTTQGVAKDVLGANKAQRRWAERLFVDPYTHNQVLRDQLEEVADYDAGGRFSTKLLPIGVVGTVLGSVRTVNTLVYDKEPDELQTLIETHLKEMGVAPDDSRAFRLNKSYTLSVQARLVASLDTLPEATGRPEYVAQAATAEAEVDARFFQEGAYMAELFHQQESPILGIIPELPGACVIAKGDRFACLYPVDYVVWTETVASYAERATRYAETNFPTARREMWLTGRSSPRAASELRKRGWTIREKSMYVLPAAPVKPTPSPAAP
jgi:hypothetical protein